MIVGTTTAAVRAAVADARRRDARIGLVPTMGFLHEGHLSLVDLARERGADFVVVSIFVNPLQFGPNEDFTRYPRDEERDRVLLEKRGVDLLFLPAGETMVPPDSVTRVELGGPASPLEGERRPGHFSGVATIVTKLFNIVQPDFAVFGQKDAQQCAVIRRLVRDLAIPVEIEIGPTRREADGLAMSSRNAYLTPDQRKAAPRLYAALSAGREALERGLPAKAVEGRMREIASADPSIAIDYLRLVAASTFDAPANGDRELVLAGAVRIGSTRLIDNIPVHETNA
ncbi:MAG: pantoate--beta-alanine ligase [Thermoanaerobaculia bacterium]